MNWLKRLLHLEEPEPVEKPEPKPPVVEPCPICGLVPKLKHVCVTRNYRDYWLEKRLVAALGMVRSRRKHPFVRLVF